MHQKWGDSRARPRVVFSPLSGGLLALLFLVGVPAGIAGGTDSRVDYRIEARLEDGTKTLTGKVHATWANRSGEDVADLWFHLYWNAYSNNRSTHLVEAKGKLRDHELKEDWGWQRVRSVRVRRAGNAHWDDLTPTFRYRRPDDGNEDDRTVFSVDLPQTVATGEELEIEVEWEARIPRVRRRAGYKDDFLLIAQWFPKLGVYEAGHGWNCHQFHMNSEFFSDYGTYEVILDLPVKYYGKVYGSGRKEYEVERGDRMTVRFVAPSSLDQLRTDRTGKGPVVHDFTWTADADWVPESYIFDFGEWAERYPDEVEFVRETMGPDKDITLRNVDVTVLVHPEHAGQAERHRKATEAALFFYGLWFGEYPYEHVTVVDPPWGGRAAGGMEYPTLFTCGTRLFTSEDMHSPEGVTVHECGHQFWYGLVGNNEFEAAWLDEGFNSFTDSEVLSRVYGPGRVTTTYASIPVGGRPVASTEPAGTLGELLSLKRIPLPLGVPLKPVRSSGALDWWRDQPKLTFVEQWTDPRWGDRSGYLRDPDTDPIDTSAWEYVDRASYRANSYPRTAAALRTLQGIVGDAAFLRGMRHYAEAWRYRHPYPDDFFAAFQEGAGSDVQWYFDEVFRGTSTADWSVEVSQQRRPRKLGFFQGEGGEFIERQDEPGEDDPEPPWQIEVVLRRKGALSLPMPFRLTFEGGLVREEVWTREEQLDEAWSKLAFEHDQKLIAVELDPKGRNFLDADMSNNRWYDREDRVMSWRWGERVLAQVQHYLHWIGGLGG